MTREKAARGVVGGRGDWERRGVEVVGGQGRREGGWGRGGEEEGNGGKETYRDSASIRVSLFIFINLPRL